MTGRFYILEKIVGKQDVPGANQKIGVKAYFLALLSLVLIGFAIYCFHLEQDLGLVQLIPFVVGGFAIHALLPAGWRLPFLFAVNLGAAFYLLGPIEGALLVGIGLALFVLANLPIAVKYRIGIVLVAGALLAAFRAGWLPLIEAKAALPVLGAMFMFRMIVYLYEMQFEKQPASLWKKLNYFFLLPNLVFVIFPVVDYSTFIRTYYSKPAFETYRHGILMMANGVLHLLAYRLIYYYLLPSPGDIHDIYSLLHFMVASYALIVRLAGIFHFSAGVICLFGFYLPPTFDHYFFANSFSDLWRRVNIYWRDFVTKVFYFPIYFRLKRYGPLFGLVGSVLVVFFINWFLHAYQWFWIRGFFPLTVQDTAFWGLFGILVAANSVLQSKRRSNQPRPGTFSWAYALRNAFQILGIFTFMIVLWSFWTSQSIREWWSMMRKAGTAGPGDVLLIALAVCLLGGVGLLIQYAGHLYKGNKLPVSPSIVRNHWMANAAMAAMVVLGLPVFHKPIEQRLGMDLEPVFFTKLNDFDQEQLYRGYYETLMADNNLSSRMWEMEQAKPDNWKKLGEMGVSHMRDDIMVRELLPNKNVIFKDAPFSTNSHGFRDQEYSLEKPVNTLRFALLGGSVEMGTGVRNEETFENRAEVALNGPNRLFGERRVEFLNFGVSSFHLFQDIAMLDDKAGAFRPDVVFVAVHPKETFRILYNIQQANAMGRDLKYPYLRQLLHDATVAADSAQLTPMDMLKAREMEIIGWGYEKVVQLCDQIGAVPVWLFVPTIGEEFTPGDEAPLERLAQEKGMFTVNLRDAFRGEQPEALKIASWDFHPNARGHELIAEELLRKLAENEALRARIDGGGK
ncbi:MAG: hypothetical protein KDC66_19605 [Phaeodactylibacter sp.]|nr:hypothetical protein [Phaeodactylibacter sp.]MCB9274880.1 hypothetical protein [Lewinellaceae bacterium]